MAVSASNSTTLSTASLATLLARQEHQQRTARGMRSPPTCRSFVQHLLSHNAVQGLVLVVMLWRASSLTLGLMDVPGNGVVAESSLYWCMDMFVLMYFPAVLLTAAATEEPKRLNSPPRSPMRSQPGSPMRSPLGAAVPLRSAASPRSPLGAARHIRSVSPENLEGSSIAASGMSDHLAEAPKRVPAPVTALPVSAIPRKASSPENGTNNASQSATHSQRSSQSTPLCTPMSTPRPEQSIEPLLCTPRSDVRTPRRNGSGSALGVVLSRWMKQSLVAAFGRWDQFTTEKQKMKFVAGKVVNRWLKQSLWSGFDKWRTFAYTSKLLKKSGGAVSRRWEHAGLRQFFLPWAAAMQETWQLRCMETKIRKWSQLHVLWAAFVTWRDAKFEDEEGVLDNVFFKLASDLDNGLMGLRTFFEGRPRRPQHGELRAANVTLHTHPGPLEEDANFVML